MAVPTRTRIRDASWELFLRHGFEGTTVTQIEAASGLSPGSGSFYRHFRSKESVLRAVVDREVERIDAARRLGPEPRTAAATCASPWHRSCGRGSRTSGACNR